MEDVKAFLLTGPSSGSSSSPVGDQQYVPLASAGNTILLFGCPASSGWNCGLFGGNWNNTAGNSNWNNAGLPLFLTFTEIVSGQKSLPLGKNQALQEVG